MTQFTGGRVSECAHIWETKTSNPVVHDWLRDGIRLPFSSVPPNFHNVNRKFTLKERCFIRQEIKSLLQSGCIVKCDTKPHCVSGLSVVPKKSNQLRLILDLRNVNAHCNAPKFTYSDINSVVEIVRPEDRLVTLDIKSGFHHLKIHKDFTTYLGFQFENVFYKFVVLVFGLNASPYFFHKTLRPVVEHLADKNIRCVVYVDDFLISAASEKILEDRDYVLSLLGELGWCLNLEKSSLNPETQKQFIGFIIDTTKNKDAVWLEIPKLRIKRVIKQWNGRCIAVDSCRETVQIATDASALGYGGIVVGSDFQAQGYWDKNMSKQSSNMRELTAVLLCLQSFKTALRGKRVSILTDNVTTAAYINFQGGPHADLSLVATQIWSLSIKQNFSISAKWLAGKLNVVPDFLSRFNSKYNWRIHPGLFHYLDSVWGPHQVDRFACMKSAMCPVYNSLFLDPMTSGVDALFQTDWARTNNYVNAPFRLLPKVLEVLDRYQATATIIAPMFRAQPFYKKLIERSIAHPIRLPQPRKFCIPLCPTTPEPMRNPKWRIYAWRVCGKRDC